MSARDYETFLAAKTPAPKPSGLTTIPALSPSLFPFQRDVVGFALHQGRAGIYGGCGLGKTAMQLDWARVVHEHTGKPVLVLAPLAVAQQTVREGAKFGLTVTYAKTQSEASKGITVTNYERLAAFDAPSFAGVVLDESGILKSYMGATKQAIISAFEATPFRLACSATPAPNDHLEIGNQSQFLGILSSHEMIARWFVADQDAMGKYRVKGHATVPFWNWVASWSRCFGHPADLGYTDARYDLPELRMHRHVLDVDVLDGRGDSLFRVPDLSATSVHTEKRRTAKARSARVAELVFAEPNEPWLVWCDTDYEADELLELMPGATEVRGSHSLEVKERAALGFSDGSIRVLISKPRIFGWGLNFQHCARVAFVGASYSYEAFYQALRRSWRFGQHRPVDVHVAMASTEMALWEVLTRKGDDHDVMRTHMRAAMLRAHAKTDDGAKAYLPKVPTRFPDWLRSLEASR